MTAGTIYPAGRSVAVLCTAAGNIILSLTGGGSISLPVSIGWNTYPFAVTSFSWPGTGAAAGTVYQLN